MSSDFLETEYGRISADFLHSKLSDLCVDKDGVQTGPFGTQLHNEDYVDIGTPIITVEHLGDNRILHSDAPLVSDADKKRLSKYQLIEGDIVFSRVGSVDRRALVRPAENGWLFSGRCLRVRTDKKKIDPTFLSYFFGLDSFKNYVRGIAVGATMPSINTKILSDLPIYFPENLDVQKKIGRILSSFDDKIELNRQTNQTLEQIAKAFFKSWFVDFEPTRAKIAAKEAGASPEEVERAAMCAISGKTPDQLAQLPPETQQNLKTTAALFPDSLVDSELGEAPEGWEIKTIDEVSKVVAMGPFGSNIKAETFVDEGIPIINGQQLKGTLLEDGKNKFVSYEHAAKLSKSNVFRDDIVITHRGTLGQVSIIPEDSQFERYIVSQSQCFIRPNKEVISPLFLIFYFKSEQGQHELLANKSQVGVPSIAQPVTNLRKIKLLVSSKKILDEFQKITNLLHKKTSKNLNEISYLESTRDVLLIKLLSGEIQLQNDEENINV